LSLTHQMTLICPWCVMLYVISGRAAMQACTMRVRMLHTLDQYNTISMQLNTRLFTAIQARMSAQGHAMLGNAKHAARA